MDALHQDCHVADAALAGQRLDAALAVVLEALGQPVPGLRGRRRLLEEGRVRVNGRQAPAAYRVRQGDSISLSPALPEVFPDPAAGGEAGLGRVGCLHEPMTLQEFSEKIKTVLKLDNIIAGDAGRRVSKVAVCGGAGAEFIDEALAAGADTFVTGDVKYHTAQNAVYSGLNIIDATHQGTELPMINTLADRIALRLTSGGFNAQVLVAKESKILQYL